MSPVKDIVLEKLLEGSFYLCIMPSFFALCKIKLRESAFMAKDLLQQLDCLPNLITFIFDIRFEIFQGSLYIFRVFRHTTSLRISLRHEGIFCRRLYFSHVSKLWAGIVFYVMWQAWLLFIWPRSTATVCDQLMYCTRKVEKKKDVSR